MGKPEPTNDRRPRVSEKAAAQTYSTVWGCLPPCCQNKWQQTASLKSVAKLLPFLMRNCSFSYVSSLYSTREENYSEGKFRFLRPVQ